MTGRIREPVEPQGREGVDTTGQERAGVSICASLRRASRRASLDAKGWGRPTAPALQELHRGLETVVELGADVLIDRDPPLAVTEGRRHAGHEERVGVEGQVGGEPPFGLEEDVEGGSLALFPGHGGSDPRAGLRSLGAKRGNSH